MFLPLIDFAQSPDPGADVDDALARFGFMQVANIGMDEALLARVFSKSAAFFALPDADKAALAYRSAEENFGFQGMLEENLDPSAPADLKQTFTMRNILNKPPPADRWPTETFRDVMQAFYANALAAAHTMQRVMARELNEAEDKFVSVHSGQNVTLRLLYYPASAELPTDAAQMGAGAHTDYGFMTLLFQKGIGGLQVLSSQDEWIDVPPQDQSIVVNSGDLLERWTNGRYRSTVHRVVPQTGRRDRLSIALFVDPDSDARIEVLPACLGGAAAAEFPVITAGEHLQEKLAATHKGRFAS